MLYTLNVKTLVNSISKRLGKERGIQEVRKGQDHEARTNMCACAYKYI